MHLFDLHMILASLAAMVVSGLSSGLGVLAAALFSGRRAAPGPKMAI